MLKLRSLSITLLITGVALVGVPQDGLRAEAAGTTSADACDPAELYAGDGGAPEESREQQLADDPAYV